MWSRLMEHPDIPGNHKKEPNFYRKEMLGRLNARALYWIIMENLLQ